MGEVFIGLACTGFILSYILSGRVYRAWFRSPEAIQDIHTQNVSRLGGVSIVVTIFVGIFTYVGFDIDQVGQRIFLVSVIGFFVGLADDISGFVPQAVRLAGVTFAGIVFGHWVGWVDHLDLVSQQFDSFWPVASILITILAVAGVPNAFNLVDGLNGLAAGFAIFVLCALKYVAVEQGYTDLNWIIHFAVIAVTSFAILNFPMGKIFLGDSGAYFLGLLIAGFCLHLNSVLADVSSWFYFLLCIYPCCETMWSILRRGKSVLRPDKWHFHQLIYILLEKKYANPSLPEWAVNAMASITCLLFSLISVFPAIKFRMDSEVLIIFSINFIAVYGLVYKYLRRRVEAMDDIR